MDDLITVDCEQTEMRVSWIWVLLKIHSSVILGLKGLKVALLDLSTAPRLV
jgi:hypothetical protein